ncbi:MAG: RHS repeat protein [Candidatus Symbiothrix sp.]|jgi:YD repeat-containing protein|nr:RHS repeat protein [Candidatus Symbiothrix sp.]
MRKNKILLLLLLIQTTNLYSQIPEAPDAALSPNAASLGLYGEIPVSLYTGTPDISIPLYDIKVSNFTLPISLNYHASGVRVDQHPGWVGLGWSLFAGGVITRQISDALDESDDNIPNGGGIRGYYFDQSILNTTNWNQHSYLKSVAKVAEKFNKDTAPDEFSFNFAGYTGKFYLNHKGEWAVQCNKPVKVEFDGTFLKVPNYFLYYNLTYVVPSYNSFPCFSGFSITTEDGTKYVFGGNINSIDFSDALVGLLWDWTATAWYLTKIILPTNQEINFTYERKEYINQMYISVNLSLGVKTKTKEVVKTVCDNHADQILPIWNYYDGRIISPVYLKEISTANTRISFAKSVSNELRYDQSIYDAAHRAWMNKGNSSYTFLHILRGTSSTPVYPDNLSRLQWYQLDTITIQNPTEIIKTIAFDYSHSSTQRLTLNGVTESGKQPYSFLYNNIDQLPDYLANQSDHWGFYNGTNAPINDTLAYYSYRNPHPTYTKYGVLTKINYPTGGYTEFEFEPHYYKKQLNLHRWEEPLKEESSNQLAGGVRIRRITSTPDGNAEIVKDYYYVSDYLQNKTQASQSSGILGGQAQYYYTDYTAYDTDSDNTKMIKSAFSSNSLLPSCQNISGSHIGYTEVIEKQTDNSFTRYKFTNFDNGYMDEQADAVIQETRTPYEPYTSKAHERGQLMLQEDYNSNGKKVRSDTISYESDNADYVRSMQAICLYMCPDNWGAGTYIEGTSCRIYTSLLRPIVKKGVYYDPDTGQKLQEQEVSYTYNSKKLLSTTSMFRSDGKKQTTKFVYPFENQNGVDSDIMKKMTDNHILSDYTEKIVYLEEGSNKPVIEGEYLKYNEVHPGIFKPERIDLLQKNTSVSFNDLNALQTIIVSLTNPTSLSTLGHFTISESGSKIKIEMSVKQDVRGATDYFALLIFKNDSQVYRQGFEEFKNNPDQINVDIDPVTQNEYYDYNVTKELNLPSGAYTFQLVRQHLSDPYDYYYEGECKISYTDNNFVTLTGNSSLQPEMYYKYNNRGNIVESKPAGSNVPTAYLWSYSNQYPIAVIQNATYEQIVELFGEYIWIINNAEVTPLFASYSLPMIYELLRSIPNALVTTYTYKPLVGIETVTDPRGVKTKYEYDPFGRLETIRDENNKTIEDYGYHYKN